MYFPSKKLGREGADVFFTVAKQSVGLGKLRRGETSHLRLRCAELGVMDLYVLSGLLKHYHHAVTEIDLSSNRICGVYYDNHGRTMGKRDHVGLSALMAALKNSSCLQSLHLGSASRSLPFALTKRDVAHGGLISSRWRVRACRQSARRRGVRRGLRAVARQ
jgi:hypothetical protein